MSTVYHYDEQALNTLAILFAPGFMHAGSKAWVDALCQEIPLSNKRVLDFGSGAGGPASEIAQYDAQILGLDFSTELIEKSRELAAQKGLTARIEFAVQKGLPLAISYKVDLILSINTLSRCKDKTKIFAEFYRIMRTSGTVAIMDWFHKSPHYSDAVKAFFAYTPDVFYLNTPQDYLQMLEKNKFGYVNFKDTTKNMRSIIDTVIMDLQTDKNEMIISLYGAEYYEWWLEYWHLLQAALQSGDLISGCVRGVRV